MAGRPGCHVGPVGAVLPDYCFTRLSHLSRARFPRLGSRNLLRPLCRRASPVVPLVVFERQPIVVRVAITPSPLEANSP
jgi:hypothetical protein